MNNYITLWVYGTLKKGFGNNCLIQEWIENWDIVAWGSKIGYAKKALVAFKAMSSSGFPVTKFTKPGEPVEHALQIELYKVKKGSQALKMIDQLEGYSEEYPEHNTFYNRIEVELLEDEKGKVWEKVSVYEYVQEVTDCKEKWKTWYVVPDTNIPIYDWN